MLNSVVTLYIVHYNPLYNLIYLRQYTVHCIALFNVHCMDIVQCTQCNTIYSLQYTFYIVESTVYLAVEWED